MPRVASPDAELSSFRLPEHRNSLLSESAARIRNNSLPIDPYLTAIAETIERNSVTVVTAETGAGKSIRVPQALMERGHRVLVTEPRVLAATSLASWVALSRGEQCGDSVGYQTALYQCCSESTRLLYCTDGLETVRRLLGSGGGCDILILDEIHEWNHYMEVLLARIFKQIQAGADLKLVLMSASVDAPALAAHLGGAPLFHVPGRLFHVEEQPPGPTIEQDVIKYVKEGMDVLVFQPGKREIDRTISYLDDIGINAECLPLHAELSLAEQESVFRTYARPKVVVATDIAQTSLTIPGIRVVLDCGLQRQLGWSEGSEGLYLLPVSMADRLQRKGRAGRTSEGIYVDFCPCPPEERPAYATPEIMRMCPDRAILCLLAAGEEMESLPFFHRPTSDALGYAYRELRSLGCLDVSGEITDRGREMASFPISVRGAAMLLEAKARNVLDQAIDVVAIYETGGICHHDDDLWHRYTDGESRSDLLAQKVIFDKIREEFPAGGGDWFISDHIAARFDVRPRALQRMIETRSLILRKLGLDDTVSLPLAGGSDVIRCVVAGMRDRIYSRLSDASDPRGSSLFRCGTDLRQLSSRSVVSEAKRIVGKPLNLEVWRGAERETLYLMPLVTRVPSRFPD